VGDAWGQRVGHTDISTDSRLESARTSFGIQKLGGSRATFSAVRLILASALSVSTQGVQNKSHSHPRLNVSYDKIILTRTEVKPVDELVAFRSGNPPLQCVLRHGPARSEHSAVRNWVKKIRRDQGEYDMKRELTQKTSCNEADYTACSLLVILTNSCGELRNQKGFDLIMCSCKVARLQDHDCCCGRPLRSQHGTRNTTQGPSWGYLKSQF
jgi:hypothetical protein